MSACQAWGSSIEEIETQEFTFLTTDTSGDDGPPEGRFVGEVGIDEAGGLYGADDGTDYGVILPEGTEEGPGRGVTLPDGASLPTGEGVELSGGYFDPPVSDAGGCADNPQMFLVNPEQQNL
ncbi:hypothetical protein [Nesterenkonia sp. PF2B19]|uniref:hypothetical protein n=1 Tax=Nesterenkonia sp. PF2B19 TaxID=1881858 RepID=UPI000872EABD|nr:hypothetical protein [Nesterenkonia sp. PF2B19]OSM42413.1 hypothetical protein BCY76_014530 [Nesterenkonia sp. PF2B19]